MSEEKGAGMKKILYLFDDINYQSGAQKVTFFQMKILSKYYKIHAFSLSRPQKEIDLQQIPVLGEGIWKRGELLSLSLRKVLLLKKISFGKKIWRFWYSALMRIGKGDIYIQKLIYEETKQELEEYDVIIVVSEASKLREMVSNLKHPKKIQWIHTDYAVWSEFSDWTKMITRKDADIYHKFDWIVTLSEHSKEGFIKRFPYLKNKTVTIPNMIDGKTILRKAKEDLNLEWEYLGVNIITVGRLDKEKAYDRVLDICGKLKDEGYPFCWYIVGEGPLKQHLKKRIRTEKLEGQVKMLGQLENPYPLMKQCDWLILLSEYEGTPVTIDEAMVLGLPVIAADVGGIREQIGRCVGYLVKKEEAYKTICNCIKKTERKESKFDYENWNEVVTHKIEKILK